MKGYTVWTENPYTYGVVDLEPEKLPFGFTLDAKGQLVHLAWDSVNLVYWLTFLSYEEWERNVYGD